MHLEERDIAGGQFNYGERIQLARIFKKEDQGPYTLIADVIECLHGTRPTAEEAWENRDYVIKVREDFIKWLQLEAEQLHIDPTPEEIQAGIDKLTEECGDMGTLVSLAEKFQCPFEQIYKMPYTDVFTILKVQTARAKFDRRLTEVYAKRSRTHA